ncbi:zinc finger protein 37-like [Penaeus chinensis]|uniref:zinc finger protein 37-like n=1 Tax=Penaeus chinensis TaxID=139456 RepID=UPI001FB77873|nr:zinc finger protein 37-like [Penaeus chinensis]
MEWNSRQQILQKWQPFGLQQQMQQIQQQQIQQQHQLQTQHQQHHPQQPQQQQQPHQQPPPPPHVQPAQVQQQQQQPQPMPQQLQQPQLQQPQQSHKIPRTGGSATPHCLVCNVHLGMFAKGGMEVFSDKVTTSFGKMQIHNVLGSIVNQELNAASIHSSIVCKKCFKLLDDIDALEGQLVNMKQVVSSKYTMTLALVKKGLVGKAVLEEPSRQPPPPPKEKKIVKNTSPAKGPKPKGPGRRGRPPKVGRPRKSGNLSVKSGKLVVKGVDESLAPEVELKEEHGDFDEEEKTDQDHEEAEETDDENTPLSCTMCDKEFSSRTILARHIETHGLTSDSLKCDICEKSFLTADSLVKHKKLHKGKKKNIKRKASCHAFDITHIKQFKCRQCSKVFTTKSKAEDHERTHTGEKPFECDICGTCFRQKSNLSSHKRVTHLQERRYKCELCDKAFKWKRLLNGHTMSIHTGERPYKCEFCEAGFVYQQHYKKHMRIHTGEKPFKCEVCGKAFNSSNNCRAHMFTHSDKKPYECTLCGAGFMRKPLVLAHIKQHGHMENLEGYVKANAPITSATAGEGSSGANNLRSPMPGIVRKRKFNREPTHTTTMHLPQGPPQPAHNGMEETIPHFVIPTNDNREQPGAGETMGYMFSTFQSQGTVGHYAPLNLGQW